MRSLKECVDVRDDRSRLKCHGAGWGSRGEDWWSVASTPVALFVFGYVKSEYTGVPPWRGGFQTVLVGGLAAAAAFGIARLLG